MDRQEGKFPLTYFASVLQACRKPAILLEEAPTKIVFPQARSQIKIANKQKGMTTSGKTRILVTREGRERYSDEAEVGATAILQNDDEFFKDTVQL